MCSVIADALNVRIDDARFADYVQRAAQGIHPMPLQQAPVGVAGTHERGRLRGTFCPVRGPQRGQDCRQETRLQGRRPP